MQIFPCPFCGPRDETEFHYVGEPKARPEPAGWVSDADMGGLPLFQRQPEGRAREIWLHMTCMEIFVMTRDTAPNAPAADAAARARSERLSSSHGRRRRSRRPLRFTFDGKPYAGFEGDSIASALLANGVGVVGRSFKYHRPRGIWGAWTEEPNAIVDVAGAA